MSARSSASNATEVQALLTAGRTPSARYEPRRCDACSLLELCRPKALEQPRRVAAWLDRLVEEER